MPVSNSTYLARACFGSDESALGPRRVRQQPSPRVGGGGRRRTQRRTQTGLGRDNRREVVYAAPLLQRVDGCVKQGAREPPDGVLGAHAGRLGARGRHFVRAGSAAARARVHRRVHERLGYPCLHRLAQPTEVGAALDDLAEHRLAVRGGARLQRGVRLERGARSAVARHAHARRARPVPTLAPVLTKASSAIGGGWNRWVPNQRFLR